MRDAAAAGMRAIGLMDNFANSSGLAALANRELGHLGVDVFGGLIMEPPAGGVSAGSSANRARLRVRTRRRGPIHLVSDAPHAPYRATGRTLS